jgi:hypothetical protein
MPDRYVNAAVGASGTGDSWAQAYKTLKEATDAAAAGETIYFATGTADVFTADTTYTLAAGVRIISTSDTTNTPPTTYAAGATLSTTTSTADAIFTGVGSLHGLNITVGDSSDDCDIGICVTDNSSIYAEDCAFTFGGTSGNSQFLIGAGAEVEAQATFVNCSFTWAATNHGIQIASAKAVFIDCDMSAGSVHASPLFEIFARANKVEMIGCDLSDISEVVTGASTRVDVVLRQCKLKSAATIFNPTAVARGETFVYDCHDGDTHINFAHYCYEGSTTISKSGDTPHIYANDNISGDISWVVAGNGNTSAANPYMSPWMSVYHSGTSAITPYLECVRSGSDVAYTEAEVWSEWTAKVTASSTQVTLYSNRTGPLATPGNNESSSKTATDWTGENATSWFGKLQPNSTITPAEPGHISARICVAGNHTVYVDPQIRGRA